MEQQNQNIDKATNIELVVNKQNNFLVILLSVLLLISVSIAGFFAYQTQTLVKELTSMKVTSTPVSTEESKDDPTADWKTFIHPTYKYQFKYPADWMAKVNSAVQAESLFGPNATQNSGIGGVEVRELEVEPKDFYKLTESKVISSNLLKVNDINGYRYEYQNIMKSNGFVFKHSDGLIYNVYINTEDEEQLRIFDQILSTFKFIEPNSISDASENQKIAVAAKTAFVKKMGKEPTTNYGLAEESLKVMGDWAFGIITVEPVGEGAGPGASYFLARKINNIWEANMEYTDEFREWLKISPSGIVSSDLKQFLQ